MCRCEKALLNCETLEKEALRLRSFRIGQEWDSARGRVVTSRVHRVATERQCGSRRLRVPSSPTLERHLSSFEMPTASRCREESDSCQVEASLSQTVFTATYSRLRDEIQEAFGGGSNCAVTGSGGVPRETRRPAFPRPGFGHHERPEQLWKAATASGTSAARMLTNVGCGGASVMPSVVKMSC